MDPKTALLGFFSPWIIYLVITLLHYTLPGKWFRGYVKNSESGELLRYRLNGLRVLIVSLALWFLLGYLEWIPFDWLYQVRWYSLAGAFTLGILYTLYAVLPHPSTGNSLVSELYLGRMDNPQYLSGRIDAKMWLYLIGAVMLELHVVSFYAHHYMKFGDLSSPGYFVCALMLSWFVFDYLSFERVHLYTYDIFAEKVGFKLGWGCLVFYPYFYAIPLWSAADLPASDAPAGVLLGSILVFLAGWMLARGANMQKYYFKTDPTRSFLGIRPESIGDGKRSLLVNGFWGLSRHVNYLGEILMGCGIALSVSFHGTWLPWLYPLYYVALLLPRQIDDDRRCASKYGELWKEYTQRVKYRILPYVY
jgi:delta14-sterol reductase